MLRWLTRLFRQREAVEAASPAPPPPPTVTPAAPELSPSSGGQPKDAVSPSEDSGESLLTVSSEPEKETCPTCGRTSVFAGPPGQRFCTYCALRDELFEASAAASE